jgi:formylglycine-generating enzyme required for sulfatase activity
VAGVCRNDDARAARDAPADRRASEGGADRQVKLEGGALDGRASDVPRPDAPAPDTVPPATPGFAVVGPGTFSMGSPATEKCREPDELLHDVTLTHVFEIQKTEVTQSELQKLITTSNPPQFSGASRPVEMVGWDEAAAYLNKLSAQKGLSPCYVGCPGIGCAEAAPYAGKLIYGCPGYRFPTEAEWEYAYRAGTKTAYHSGDNDRCDSKGDPNLDKIGWYYDSATHDVGGKQANAWGLLDMSGNVWEWTTDWYAGYPSTAVVDPGGPSSGTQRVARGGAWNSVPQAARAANRGQFLIVNQGTRQTYTEIGFRAARTLK